MVFILSLVFLAQCLLINSIFKFHIFLYPQPFCECLVHMIKHLGSFFHWLSCLWSYLVIKGFLSKICNIPSCTWMISYHLSIILNGYIASFKNLRFFIYKIRLLQNTLNRIHNYWIICLDIFIILITIIMLYLIKHLIV